MTRIDADIECVICNHSIRGSELDGTCPNCNSAIHHTLHLPAVDLQTNKIKHDIICPSCEYNLKTKDISSVCPECGAPVLEAIERYSYFSRKKEGVKRLLISSIGIPAVFATGLWLSCIFESDIGDLTPLVLFVLIIIFASGSLRVAERPVTPVFNNARNYIGWGVRLGFILPSLWLVRGFYLVESTPVSVSNGNEEALSRFGVWLITETTMLGIGFICILSCLRRISETYLNSRLNQATRRIILLLWVIIPLALFQFNPFRLEEHTEAYSTWKHISVLLRFPLFALLIITNILTIFLLFRYYRLLSRDATAS